MQVVSIGVTVGLWVLLLLVMIMVGDAFPYRYSNLFLSTPGMSLVIQEDNTMCLQYQDK
jgi:hypothetical protein